MLTPPPPAEVDTSEDAPFRRLSPVQPRTMVEQAAEAIVAAAARGAFLPGDRLVEAEIARDLGISRVPVREALRLLESQGIVVSTPYKGMRLMQVTNGGVAELMRGAPRWKPWRCASCGARRRPARLARARRPPSPMRPRLAAATGRHRRRDEAFHGEFCRASGNAVLHGIWLGLARQLSVVWGLGHDVRGKPRIAEEHARILDCLERGDGDGAQAALDIHLAWHAGVDFEQLLRDRRGSHKR